MHNKTTSVIPSPSTSLRAGSPRDLGGRGGAKLEQRLLLAVAIALLLCVPLHAAPPDANSLTLTFGSTTVTASGATPGADVVFFAIARIGHVYDYSTERYVKVVAATRNDGVATLDLQKPVPARSIWAAVDLRTARYAVAGPAGFFLEISPAPANLLRNGTSGKVDTFAFDHPVLDFLYVHPGIGAWALAKAQDGDSRTDHDGPNGLTTVSLEDAAKVGDGPAHAEEVVTGGVVVALDWYKMQAVVFRVDAGAIGGAH